MGSWEARVKCKGCRRPVGVTKVGGIFVQSGPIGDSGGNPNHSGGAHSCRPPPSRPRSRQIDDLERAIHEAVEAEIGQLAANLATTDDARLFGNNEFRIRAIALKIAARAYEQHLARKKTDTTAPE